VRNNLRSVPLPFQMEKESIVHILHLRSDVIVNTRMIIKTTSEHVKFNHDYTPYNSCCDYSLDFFLTADLFE
jgi:hypothetical protein